MTALLQPDAVAAAWAVLFFASCLVLAGLALCDVVPAWVREWRRSRQRAAQARRNRRRCHAVRGTVNGGLPL